MKKRRIPPLQSGLTTACGIDCMAFEYNDVKLDRAQISGGGMLKANVETNSRDVKSARVNGMK